MYNKVANSVSRIVGYVFSTYRWRGPLRTSHQKNCNLKSTKLKPSAQWAVLVSLVAHQTIEALTGIYVGALVEGEVEPSLIAIVTLILRGRHTY